VQYNVIDNRKYSLPSSLPYLVGGILVVGFISLGLWQANRGLQKRAEQAGFEVESGFSSWHDGADVQPFEKLKATGEFDADHQLLLENIIVHSRQGYYVITPLITAAAEPVLLVNRGWIEKTGQQFDTSAIGFSATRVTVRGRAGALPRAGFRMGDPVSPGSSWPKFAVYPTLEDVSIALGRPVQPFVLLMDPEDPYGYVRDWEPEEIGPGRHFGYALQWFAMAIVLAALLVWNYRKRSFEE
jgi:surfeit locus 1 family protein